MTSLMKKLGNTDAMIFCKIYTNTRCLLLNILMPVVTQLGSAEFTISLVVLMYVLGDSFVTDAALISALSLCSSHIAAHFIKRIINRPRPWQSIEGVAIYNFNLKAYSFPSGHTTAAFSVGTALSLCFPHASSLFVILAALVGLSRIYLGVHYPSDVIAGSALGIVSAHASCFLLHSLLF